MAFQWDSDKAEINIDKHGIDFIDASRIFSGIVLRAADRRYNYGEDRYIAIGEVEGVVLCVVYTERDDTIRLISAWKAGRREREQYRALLAARPSAGQD